MRLFVAVELSDAAREGVSVIQRTVVDGLLGAGRFRLVKPEHQHLTLVFIGEIAEPRSRPIVRAMERPVPLAPFRVTFRQVEAFPPRGAPRVLILAAGDGSEAVVRLHEHVSDRLADIGVPREERPFRPHLTLGRWRESRPSDRPPRGWSPGEPVDLDVAGVALFHSRLSAAGPSYTRLAAARLVCP